MPRHWVHNDINLRGYDGPSRHDHGYVVARVESGLELSQLNSSLKLGANVESSEKLIFRVDLLLVS